MATTQKEHQALPVARSVETQQDSITGETVSIAALLGNAISRQVTGRVDSSGSHVDASAIKSRLGGRPPPSAVRPCMEQGFGRDVGAVRIHIDSSDAELSRSLGVRASTMRQDLPFGDEESDPNTNDGLRLLAHELTHVAQQSGAAPVLQCQSLGISSPTDTAEVEADRIAEQVVRGVTRFDDRTNDGASRAMSVSATTAQIQREPTSKIENEKKIPRQKNPLVVRPTLYGADKVDSAPAVQKYDVDGYDLVTTQSCGYIDRGHLNPKHAKGVIEAVERANQSFGEDGSPVEFCIPSQKYAGGFASTTTCGVLNRPITDDEELVVALDMFKEQSLVSEQQQQATENLAKLRGGGSSFSAEDLPSNILSFYRAAFGMSEHEIYDACGFTGKTDNKPKGPPNKNFWPLDVAESDFPPASLGDISTTVPEGAYSITKNTGHTPWYLKGLDGIAGVGNATVDGVVDTIDTVKSIPDKAAREWGRWENWLIRCAMQPQYCPLF